MVMTRDIPYLDVVARQWVQVHAFLVRILHGGFFQPSQLFIVRRSERARARHFSERALERKTSRRRQSPTHLRRRRVFVISRSDRRGHGTLQPLWLSQQIYKICPGQHRQKHVSQPLTPQSHALTHAVLRMEGAKEPSRAPITLSSFHTREDLSQFATGCDADIGGTSTLHLELDECPSRSGSIATARFWGEMRLDVRPELKGKIRGGYAGFRSKVGLFRSLLRYAQLQDYGSRGRHCLENSATTCLTTSFLRCVCALVVIPVCGTRIS